MRVQEFAVKTTLFSAHNNRQMSIILKVTKEDSASTHHHPATSRYSQCHLRGFWASRRGPPARASSAVNLQGNIYEFSRCCLLRSLISDIDILLKSASAFHPTDLTRHILGRVTVSHKPSTTTSNNPFQHRVSRVLNKTAFYVLSSRQHLQLRAAAQAASILHIAGSLYETS